MDPYKAQELATSMSEPLLSQLVTPMTPLATPPDQVQPFPTSRPPDYDTWSKNKKYRWRHR